MGGGTGGRLDGARLTAAGAWSLAAGLGAAGSRGSAAAADAGCLALAAT